MKGMILLTSLLVLLASVIAIVSPIGYTMGQRECYGFGDCHEGYFPLKCPIGYAYISHSVSTAYCDYTNCITVYRVYCFDFLAMESYLAYQHCVDSEMNSIGCEGEI